MAYTVKDVLEVLFKDAPQVMESLSAKSGEFTSQQFLKQIAQQNQQAYVELLNRCLQSTGNPSPFNAAHQHIGNKLSEVARKAGYDGPHDEG